MSCFLLALLTRDQEVAVFPSVISYFCVYTAWNKMLRNSYVKKGYRAHEVRIIFLFCNPRLRSLIMREYVRAQFSSLVIRARAEGSVILLYWKYQLRDSHILFVIVSWITLYGKPSPTGYKKPPPAGCGKPVAVAYSLPLATGYETPFDIDSGKPIRTLRSKEKTWKNHKKQGGYWKEIMFVFCLILEIWTYFFKWFSSGLLMTLAMYLLENAEPSSKSNAVRALFLSVARLSGVNTSGSCKERKLRAWAVGWMFIVYLWGTTPTPCDRCWGLHERIKSKERSMQMFCKCLAVSYIVVH